VEPEFSRAKWGASLGSFLDFRPEAFQKSVVKEKNSKVQVERLSAYGSPDRSGGACRDLR
jgi:hypothetical protein